MLFEKRQLIKKIVRLLLLDSSLKAFTPLVLNLVFHELLKLSAVTGNNRKCLVRAAWKQN